MKKSSILILLLFTGLLSSAKAYEPILDKDSTRWNYSSDLRTTDFSHVTEIFVAKGDTLIDSFEYKKMYRSIIDYSDDNTDLYGYVREDTVQGKAWLLDTELKEEILFYDISLQEGDTFKLYHYDRWFNPESELWYETLEVTGVDSFMNRKIINFLFHNEFLFIEGIGCNKSFERLYGDGFSPHSFLLCAYKSGQLVYDNPGRDSCYESIYIKVKKYNQNHQTIKVIQEPGNIRVALPARPINDAYVQLYHVNGCMITRKKIYGKETRLNTLGLAPGLYLVKATGYPGKKILLFKN
jgi:hypothetical protein